MRRFYPIRLVSSQPKKPQGPVTLLEVTHLACSHSLSRSQVGLCGPRALGDPKRTHFMEQLEGAGPVEMETAARQAIMTGDLVLSSAIATVVDRRPKDRRPFAVKAFVDRVIGPVWERVNMKLEGVQLSFKSALAADREFVRGQADPLMNLSVALSQKAMAEAEGEEK